MSPQGLWTGGSGAPNWDLQYAAWFGSKCMWAAGAVGGVYGGVLALLYAFQRNIIFPRPPVAAPPTARGGRLVKGAGGEVAVYYPARAGQNTVVFWHGNGDQIGHVAAHLGRLFADHADIGFYGIEYPGYGVAPGAPSEGAILRASEALLARLVRPPPGGLGVDPESVVLFGQSIGCAPALTMATRGHGRRLILLSPFASLQDMALAVFPPLRILGTALPFFLHDTFDNRAKARLVRVPSLVVHGLQDEIVPFPQGEEVASLVPGAEFMPLDGVGHNDALTTEVLTRVTKFVLEHRPQTNPGGAGRGGSVRHRAAPAPPGRGEESATTSAEECKDASGDGGSTEGGGQAPTHDKTE